jgi:hypothetical protein
MTTEITAEMAEILLFLGQHFQDDIDNAQAGPYDYSDQERNNCRAAVEWASAVLESLGHAPGWASLGIDETFHQADAIALEKGLALQPWAKGQGLL